MSPKQSSLAYSDLAEEGLSVIAEAFVPELSVITGKQNAYDRRAYTENRPMSISGSLQVSF